MQLFISQPMISGETLILQEERVVKYMGRVLRMKGGDVFQIQANNIHNTKSLKRWTVEVIEISKKEVIGRIVAMEERTLSGGLVHMLIALPNKFSKVELTIQKLTEVGIDDIILRPAQRSIIKDISSKRMERLQSIALESVEQCKRWTVPSVRMVEDIEEELSGREIVVFDFVEQNPRPSGTPLVRGDRQLVGERMDVVGVVGPEGHFGEKDYAVLDGFVYRKQSLGEDVLRTETAAIVGGRWLKNVGL